MLTIGYGTNLKEGITKEDAVYLLRQRLLGCVATLRVRWAPFDSMQQGIRDALADMCYQLGATGVLGFRDMLGALERGDWKAAYVAGIDSSWYRETPNRALRVLSLLGPVVVR